MKTLRDALRRGDPLANEDDLPREQVEAMRVRVLAGRQVAPPRRVGLLLTVAATAVVAVTGGLAISRAVRAPAVDLALDARPMAPAAGSRIRQVQYRTPGGTRVIWTLNPNLEVR